MSYTVDIVSGSVPAQDRDAWSAIELWREELYAAAAQPSSEMKALHDRLTARYPCITVDESGPWSDGPLINNFGTRMVILGISYSHVKEVLPFVVRTAMEMGLTVFDGQDDRIYRPGRGGTRGEPERLVRPSVLWIAGALLAGAILLTAWSLTR